MEEEEASFYLLLPCLLLPCSCDGMGVHGGRGRIKRFVKTGCKCILSAVL